MSNDAPYDALAFAATAAAPGETISPAARTFAGSPFSARVAELGMADVAFPPGLGEPPGGARGEDLVVRDVIAAGGMGRVLLAHDPVLDREGGIVTTAVTNLDIHDLARSQIPGASSTRSSTSPTGGSGT